MNVSLDDPLPEVFLDARLVVDDWRLIAADRRRALGRLAAAGLIERPDAELGEIIVGDAPGRTDPNQVILVNPFGLAVEDVALAQRVYSSAREWGLGVYLER